MNAEELVKEIATESPITAAATYNFCRYCDVGWAEDDYQLWQDNQVRLENEPDNRLRFSHHEPDCLWVRANEICSK